jgi:hypothetical protein
MHLYSTDARSLPEKRVGMSANTARKSACATVASESLIQTGGWVRTVRR